MKLSILAVLGGLAVYTSAFPAPSTHVVHEKREVQLDKWTRRNIKLNRDALIPMSIGLTQNNLDNGYDFLMDVSHPESANYGKHWSFEKVPSLFHYFKIAFPNSFPCCSTGRKELLRRSTFLIVQLSLMNM
jgi:tripeptidyl-peptidase-1